MTDWMMLDWRGMVECFLPYNFSFRERNNSTRFTVFFMRLRLCIVADCLHTNHVTTTGAPARCPDSCALPRFLCLLSVCLLVA